MTSLGLRYATVEEVNKAREAATPGSVNKWTATRQVKPRNLPGKVKGDQIVLDMTAVRSRARLRDEICRCRCSSVMI